jgi:hypothetical protein
MFDREKGLVFEKLILHTNFPDRGWVGGWMAEVIENLLGQTRLLGSKQEGRSRYKNYVQKPTLFFVYYRHLETRPTPFLNILLAFGNKADPPSPMCGAHGGKISRV